VDDLASQLDDLTTEVSSLEDEAAGSQLESDLAEVQQKLGAICDCSITGSERTPLRQRGVLTGQLSNPSDLFESFAAGSALGKPSTPSHRRAGLLLCGVGESG
jgi:hypothetical protein